MSKYTAEALKTRKPIFDSKSKDVASLLPSKLIEYGFEDKVKLKNGTEVSFTVGGCAHYGFRFEWSGKDIQIIKSSKKLSRAESLLKSLVLHSSSERDILLKALTEAKKKSDSEVVEGIRYLPCGDAVCDLADKGDHRVEIGYSFPL
ncbi:MAG: hypothetical protein NDI61_05380 [Bdellovibrionaceae bacterium]|nr:hypothetical protein [Pseudobdellovibrionaceae bacterium]